MTAQGPEPPPRLLRDVLVFQFKLILDALRDLVMSPVTFTAALLDLVLLHRQKPRYFYGLLRFGKRTEDWIDLWADAMQRHPGAPGENVDAVLDRVEDLLRDPQAGAHKARVLRRWAEMQMHRRQRKARNAVSTGEDA